MIPRRMSWKSTTAPGNSQFIVVLDTTRGLKNDMSAVSSGAAGLIPLSTTNGGYRGRWTGGVVRGSVLCTGQNVTLLLKDLTGDAGAAADWEPQGTAGTVTVTAGATQTFEFKPLTPDYSVVIQAGATGPTTCVVKIAVTWGEDYGS